MKTLIRWLRLAPQPTVEPPETELLTPAQAVLAFWQLPTSAARAMVADALGACLLALLCNAAGKQDAAYYAHKVVLLCNAISRAQFAGWGVWRERHRFAEQQHDVDVCVFIQTGIGRMSWHVRSDDPDIADLLATLPWGIAGWDGTSKQAIARELAVRWMEGHGYEAE